jgi:putative ABC transport system permease protein
MMPLAPFLRLLRVNASQLARMPGYCLTALLGFAGVMFILTVTTAARQSVLDMALNEQDSQHYMVMRAGSPSEMISLLSRDTHERVRANVAQAGMGERISTESLLAVNTRQRDGGPAHTMSLRGLEPAAGRLPGVRLVQGRWFAPGSAEVVVGQRASQQFAGLKPGDRIKWGQQQWSVVGVFAGGGGPAESEVWASLPAVQQAFRAEGSVQSAHVWPTRPTTSQELKRIIQTGNADDLEVISASDYAAGQMRFLLQFSDSASLVLGVYLVCCVLLATMSTMDSLMEPRQKTWRVIQAMGYDKRWLLMAAAAEGLLIGVLGGALGVGAATLLFDATMVGSSAAAQQFVYVLNVKSGGATLLLLIAGLCGAAGAGWAARRLLGRGTGLPGFAAQ